MTPDIQDDDPTSRHSRHFSNQLKEFLALEMMSEFHGHDQINGCWT